MILNIPIHVLFVFLILIIFSIASPDMDVKLGAWLFAIPFWIQIKIHRYPIVNAKEE